METFPNVFTAAFIGLNDDVGRFFEISDRRNEAGQLHYYLTTIKRMFGFNNLHFDWPILDHFLKILQHTGSVTAYDLYLKAEAIIRDSEFGKPGPHTIWNPQIEQVDVFKIHHFDNKAKRTSLKALQFNMRSERVQDLPFPVGTYLTPDQIPVLLNYNGHDVLETRKFVKISMPMIEFRETLGKEFMNKSDVSIGESLFIERLEAAGVRCYDRVNGKRTPRQTRRDSIPLNTVVFPWIRFQRPEFEAIRTQILDTTITQTRGDFKISFDVDGLPGVIGAGGIHASMTKKAVSGDHILDVDVTGFYPAISIQHRVYPEHLGEKFCDVYETIKLERDSLPKSDPRSGALKLANNGAFGKSNSRYSALDDPAFMLKITVNGQLMQLMLGEMFANIPGVKIIQMNTDGQTIQYPGSARDAVEAVYWDWQRMTRMSLEHDMFSRIWIHDVNCYLAVTPAGKVKRKDDYDYEKRSGSIGGQVAWDKNFGKLVVPKAAEAALIHDIDPADFIMNHDDPWDFLMRHKIPQGSHIEYRGDKLTGLIRYYVSSTGAPFVKVMPPNAPGKPHRRIGIHAEGQADCLGERKNYRCSICGEKFGTKSAFNDHNKIDHSWKITTCNVFDGSMPTDIDHRFYLQEAEKLIF